MSEINLQKALLYLYANIDRHSTYSEAIFEQFSLTSSEKQSLEELMNSQRERLLLFNDQLRHKRLRAIRLALPKSGAFVSRQFEAQMAAYASRPVPEGARHAAGEVRAFADYVGARIKDPESDPEALEFIRVEAICAAVSLSSPSRDFDAPPVHPLPGDLRLSSAGDAALIECRYDVLAAMENPSLLGTTSDRLLQPCRFFVFQASRSELRVLKIAPKLAGVLALLQSGASLEEVLETLGSAEKAAASASIENLWRSGAPFFQSAGETSHERPIRTAVRR